MKKKDEEYTMEELSSNLLEEGLGYMKTLKRYLTKPSRFDDELLFNMTVICYEKFLTALITHYNEMPLSHEPSALFEEAQKQDGGLTKEMGETMNQIKSHESICSFENKGYKVPTSKKLKEIISGLIPIEQYISKKVKQPVV